MGILVYNVVTVLVERAVLQPICGKPIQMVMSPSKMLPLVKLARHYCQQIPLHHLLQPQVQHHLVVVTDVAVEMQMDSVQPTNTSSYYSNFSTYEVSNQFSEQLS